MDGVSVGVSLPRDESAVGLAQRNEDVHVLLQLEEVLRVGRPTKVVLRLVRDGRAARVLLAPGPSEPKSGP